MREHTCGIFEHGRCIDCGQLANTGNPVQRDIIHLQQKTIDQLRADNEVYRSLISQLLNDLPTNRDWLDPAIENNLKELVEDNKLCAWTP